MVEKQYNKQKAKDDFCGCTSCAWCFVLLLLRFIGCFGMIKLTRLNGIQYYVNPHQIECIEINPDTTLVMQSGKCYIVREEADDVLGKIEEYRRRLNPPVAQE